MTTEAELIDLKERIVLLSAPSGVAQLTFTPAERDFLLAAIDALAAAQAAKSAHENGWAAGIEAACGEVSSYWLRERIRALRPPAAGARHTDRSVPCPTCGFVVRQVERRPLVIEDDE